MSDRRTMPRQALIALLLSTVSPSKLDLWTRCQWAWFARYVLGIKRPPSAAQAWGNAYDGTANGVYADKLQTGETASETDTVARYADQWDQAREEVEDWGDDRPGKLLDQGIDLTRIWHRRAARAVQPRAVQLAVRRRVVVSPAETFAIEGFADVDADVDGHRTIIDHKAGRRQFKPADLFHSTQALAYPFCEPGGDAPTRFSLHAGVRLEASVKWSAVTRGVSRNDTAAFARTAVIGRRQMAHALQTGDFLPNRTDRLCSRRWCGFWQECERANGGTVQP